MKLARLGLLLEQAASERRWSYGLNAFEHYLTEILSHAGFTYQVIDAVEGMTNKQFDVVIAGLHTEDEKTVQALCMFAERGGTVISYAGLNSAAKKLGYRRESELGAGYAEQLDPTAPTEAPLRYLRAVPWTKQATDELAEVVETGRLHKDHPAGPQAGAVLHSFKVGFGRIERWAVDIPGTVVRMQQGSAPVLEDGVPAPDGTSPVDDGLLKADDKIELDYEHDRVTSETGAVYFAHPYADLWREALVSHLLRCVLDAGLTFPFVDVYPDGVEHVAMISHDSDWSSDEAGAYVLDELKALGIHSTWCLVEPGYGVHIHERIKEEGHEVALHYNALAKDGGVWSFDAFVSQSRWANEVAGDRPVTSNKNHYTRFEGWGELFAWCEACGIASDQTRGPSKKGNVGFLFGTCHPYQPMAWAHERNRLYDVFEIGFLTQDIPSWTDESVIEPFLEQVARVNGVAHFLFHQVRIHSESGVVEALRKVVRQAKERGYTFWTGEQIHAWERARRQIRLYGIYPDGKPATAYPAGARGARVCVPVDQGQPATEQESFVMRYGVPCKTYLLT